VLATGVVAPSGAGGGVAMATRRAEIAQALTFKPMMDRLVPKRRASLRREVPRAMAPQFEVRPRPARTLCPFGCCCVASSSA
jgi:hypothetical protein